MPEKVLLLQQAPAIIQKKERALLLLLFQEEECNDDTGAWHATVCGVGVTSAILGCRLNAGVVVGAFRPVVAALVVTVMQARQRIRKTAGANRRQQNNVRGVWPM